MQDDRSSVLSVSSLLMSTTTNEVCFLMRLDAVATLRSALLVLNFEKVFNLASSILSLIHESISNSLIFEILEFNELSFFCLLSSIDKVSGTVIYPISSARLSISVVPREFNRGKDVLSS